MPDLQHRQQKIQEKRRATPRKEFIRDLASRVGLTYYRNAGKISVYPDSDRINTLVTAEKFAQMRDDQPSQDIDPDLGFFEQYLRLQQQIAFPALNHVGNTEQVSYAEGVINARSCYLSNTIVADCEDILYSFNVKDNTTKVFNSVHVCNNCDSIFESHSVTESSLIFYSSRISNSHNIWFCANMVGCAECINCSGLDNKSYCIENKEYTKEEYFARKESMIQVLLKNPQVKTTDDAFVYSALTVPEMIL